MKYISLVIFYVLFLSSQQLITSEAKKCRNKKSISFNNLKKDSKKDLLIPNQGKGPLERMPHMRELSPLESRPSNSIRILILSSAETK